MAAQVGLRQSVDHETQDNNEATSEEDYDDEDDETYEDEAQSLGALKIPCVFFDAECDEAIAEDRLYDGGGSCPNGDTCPFCHGPDDPRFPSNDEILAKARSPGDEGEAESDVPWDASTPGCTSAHCFACEVSIRDSQDKVAAELRKMRDSGVDLCAKNAEGRSPAEYAGAHGKSNVLRALHMDLNVDVGLAALGAACYGAVGALETLHDLGYDLATPPDGHVPFSAAVVASQVGNVPVLRALLELGVDFPALDVDNEYGFVYDAAERDHAAVIRFLINAGCDIDRTNGQSDSTAVGMAAQEGAMQALATLIDLGCDVNKPNALPITPLCIAETCGNLEAAELLSAAGAKRCGQGQDCAICSGGRQQLMCMGTNVVCMASPSR